MLSLAIEYTFKKMTDNRLSYVVLGIEVQPLLKANETFHRFSQNLNSDQDKAGAIQAFEFCFELGWKTMKRFLSQKGVDVRSPRDCFRETALNKMIPDPTKWFKFLEKRSLTVHTYDETVVEDIIEIFPEFSKAMNEFLDYIKVEHERG